ncbi:MAG: methyl-accepting chemotaxis protein [Deltaproteobacteria bacterium]|jgi:methyl-accepting chemotaxis protein|nr:methyl-accepting chemotaxis protein [Deltaproteobacteria bacterium]
MRLKGFPIKKGQIVSFKLKIIVLVGLFVLVSLLIGISGVVAIKIQSNSLEESVETTHHFSSLENVAFYVEEVSSLVRGLLLTDDSKKKEESVNQIHAIMNTEMGPLMQSYVPLPEEAESWARLLELWDQYKAGAEDVIKNSVANTGYYAMVMSRDYSYKYWMSYEEPLTHIIEEIMKIDHWQAKDVLFSAMDCIEAIKSLQLHEKMGLQATDSETREQYFTQARTDMARMSKDLNDLEKLLLSPLVSEEDYKKFNEGFNRAGANKITFLPEGKVEWTLTQFPAPANFINRSLRDISQYYWTTIKPMRGGGTQIFNKLSEMAASDTNVEATRIMNEICYPTNLEMVDIITELIEKGQGRLSQSEEDAKQNTAMALKLLYLVTIIGLVVGIILAFLYTSSLNKSLKMVTAELGDISNQIEVATDQMAQAADSLAQGASEQAVSIKETRSSLENLSQSIEQNTAHAQQTNSIMNQTTDEVIQAEELMIKANEAMSSIAQAGSKIEQILKSINGIAFQTNLLALNAAVEASRAGEAGAGFAIVAEEVRNLAVKCSEAAKDSADLINQMIHAIDNGSKMVSTTTGQLEASSKLMTTASQLVSEMTQSSEDQTQHIHQLHDTVVQMEQVIHANSAVAEETAGAAGGLNQQVHVLHLDMEHLTQLTEGNKKA